MKTRIFHTSVWDDDWFYNLSRDAKDLYIYCLHNQDINLSGIYQLPDRKIKLHLPHLEELDKPKDEIKDRVFFYKGWVFVKDAPRLGGYKGEKNEEAMKKELESVPDEIRNVLIEGKSYRVSENENRVFQEKNTSINHKSEIINNNSEIIIRNNDSELLNNKQETINHNQSTVAVEIQGTQIKVPSEETEDEQELMLYIHSHPRGNPASDRNEELKALRKLIEKYGATAVTKAIEYALSVKPVNDDPKISSYIDLWFSYDKLREHVAGISSQPKSKADEIRKNLQEKGIIPKK